MLALETIRGCAVATAAGACKIGIRGVIGVGALVGDRSHGIHPPREKSPLARTVPRPEG
jgi:hypothetical protein